MTSRVGRITASLAVLAAIVAVAPAGADVKHFSSIVHMHGLGPDPEYDSWIGDVHSRKRACERGRTVVVVYNEPPKPFKVGSDVTDRLGHWRVAINLPGKDDPYNAVVRRKVIGHGDDKIVCEPDRSPDFRVVF